MFTLRCTKRLLQRLKAAPVADPPPATTRLGDWFANLLYVGRQQLVMAMNERSLLCVLFPARELSNLPAALPSAVAELLGQMEVPATMIAEETAEMRELTIATTNSRSVLGSMNDLASHVKYYLAVDPDTSLLELALRLNETPMSTLDYRYQSEVAMELMGCSGVNPKRRDPIKLHNVRRFQQDWQLGMIDGGPCR